MIIAAIILILLAGMIGLSLLLYGWKRDLGRANDWGKLLQTVLSFAAFALAGYWYFVERKGMPHADVSQVVEVLPVPALVAPGAGAPDAARVAAVEVQVSVKNLGQRMLRINRIQSYLQDIEGDTYDYRTLSGLSGNEYWSATRPKNAGRQFNFAELRWPVARRFVGNVDHEIEPGETDLIPITFLVRCAGVRHVRVATDIWKPGSDPDRELAWKTRSIADLSPACDAAESRGNRRRDQRESLR